jgi:hypothetical protein
MYTSNEPLSNEQIQCIAPSAFAGQAYEKQSQRYAFVPTSAVIDGMRLAGFEPVSAMQSSTKIVGKENFTKHMIRFRSQSLVSKLGDSRLETVLINSHDGTSCYQLSLGVFRLVCLNGMVVGDTFESVHVRHTGNIIDRVIDASNQLLLSAPLIETSINKWRTIELSQPEQHLLAEGAHALRFDENTDLADSVNPDKLLTIRRDADKGSDLWSVFNRIQENTIRGGLRSISNATRNRIKTRGVKGIDQNIKLNKALWTLAEKMAELKS